MLLLGLQSLLLRFPHINIEVLANPETLLLRAWDLDSKVLLIHPAARNPNVKAGNINIKGWEPSY